MTDRFLPNTLPQRDGFEFIGIFRDGSEHDCKIIRDPRTRHCCAYSGGVRVFARLVAWRHKADASVVL